MKRTVLEIYSLAVCFGAIICLVIASGIALYDVVRVINPELTLNQYDYDRHQTNDAYWQSNPIQHETRSMMDSSGVEKAVPAGENKRPSEKVLTQKRLDNYKLALGGEVRSATQSLIRTVILIFISAFLFITHWRLARRARDEASADRS